jgi:hypothetical protein
LVGPIGIFIYWIIRIFYAKRINLYEWSCRFLFWYNQPLRFHCV